MVRLAGLEPARVTPLPPQSSVSANSTISALHTNEAGLKEVRKVIFCNFILFMNFGNDTGFGECKENHRVKEYAGRAIRLRKPAQKG